MITHIVSDTGIGDFGPDGIASFLDDHRCGSICQGLGLHRQVPQAASDSDSSSSSSEEEEEEHPEGHLNKGKKKAGLDNGLGAQTI
jgi:hypothetical protein